MRDYEGRVYNGFNMSMDSVLAKKSYVFALDVVKTYKKVSTEKREFVLCKQFLRSGTSIGANIREAIGAQSKADFIAKLSIAHKETLETDYWICLLRDSDYLENERAMDLIQQAEELRRIIVSTLLTSKSNISSSK